MRTLPLSVCALALAAAAPAVAGDVVIQVSGLADGSGKVAAAICTEAEFLKTCRFATSVKAQPGAVTIRIPSVPPGRYAVQVHHDRDGDGKVGTNLVGIPNEPVGFSRDAPMRFGPPRFEDAVVPVGPGTLTVPVRLKG